MLKSFGPFRFIYRDGVKRSYSKTSKPKHIQIAEKALGHPLPVGAVVHHVNCDHSDNRNSNLVICENAQYHELLHKRTKAFILWGNSDANNNLISISVYVDRDQWKKIKDLAKDEKGSNKKSASWHVRTAIQKYLESLEVEESPCRDTERGQHSAKIFEESKSGVRQEDTCKNSSTR